MYRYILLEYMEKKWCLLRVICFASFGLKSVEEGRGYLIYCAGGCCCIQLFIATPGQEGKAGQDMFIQSLLAEELWTKQSLADKQ